MFPLSGTEFEPMQMPLHRRFPFLEVFTAHEEVFLVVGVGMEHHSGELA